MLQHPLSRIPGRLRWPALLIMLVLTTGVALVMRVPLTTPAAPQGIVSYELAGTAEAAQAILDAWGPVGRANALYSLQVDFIFLLVYSTTIALACLMAGTALQGRWATLAVVLAWGQWLAALLDAIENLALLRMLSVGVSQPWPLIARWAAIGKFALVLVGILFALGGGLVWCARAILRRQR